MAVQSPTSIGGDQFDEFDPGDQFHEVEA